MFFYRFTRVLRDFGELRPSDVVVVNWGAHYHETPEQEARFREDVGNVLDGLGDRAENATMVWR